MQLVSRVASIQHIEIKVWEITGNKRLRQQPDKKKIKEKKGRNCCSSSKSNVYSKNNGGLGSYNQNDIKILLILPVSPFSH